MKKNPIALVTGGSKRIGKQICIDLAKNNYDIIIAILSESVLLNSVIFNYIFYPNAPERWLQ